MLLLFPSVGPTGQPRAALGHTAGSHNVGTHPGLWDKKQQSMGLRGWPPESDKRGTPHFLSVCPWLVA